MLFEINCARGIQQLVMRVEAKRHDRKRGAGEVFSWSGRSLRSEAAILGEQEKPACWLGEVNSGSSEPGRVHSAPRESGTGLASSLASHCVSVPVLVPGHVKLSEATSPPHLPFLEVA